MDKKINDFIIFCMEFYKEKHNLTGKEVLKLFEKNKVFDYLEEFYDVLHTQGKKWIMDDIDGFIENNK